jgi:hypothetical protein
MNINDYILTETLADYDAIVQYTNSSVKSEHPIISNLKCGDIIHDVTIRHGHIDGEMVIKTYTDEEFTVYHNGLKISLKFTPEMLPEITFHNGESERLFKCELVPSVHPKFKPDTLVQLIRDPEADFKYIEEDITSLCYVGEYVDSLEGFSMTQIQKKVTNIESRPYTLCVSTRFFSLVELNKYLFKVIDVDFGKICD